MASVISDNAVRIRFGTVLVFIFLVCLTGAAAAYPQMAAYTCPTCYGFQSVGDRIFVEDGISEDSKSRVETVISNARSKAGRFYGTLENNAAIFVCATQACYDDVGGGRSRGMAVLDRALFLSPQGSNATIAAHELSHIELHHRLGWLGTMRRDVPQWFDEGVAVIVSDDPRYLAAEGTPDRCLVSPDGDLPTTTRAWIHQAAYDPLYEKAACRVSKWMKEHGGSTTVAALVDRVGHGEAFETLYANGIR